MSKRMTRREAAKYCTEKLGLPITPGTLMRMASTGDGPPYSMWGNKAIYEEPELERWAESRLSARRRSTSEAA
jgi:hypothetical protein